MKDSNDAAKGIVNSEAAPVVGRGIPNIDAVSRVMGRAKYAGDVNIPGMLYARVLRSPVAHARVNSIDTSAALALPGVYAVLTGADCPDQPYGVQIADEYILARDKVRFHGDEIAVVVAADAQIAEEALYLIKVDYEELPEMLDPVAALAVDAPPIHDHGNLAKHIDMVRGDVDQAFAAAEVITEHEYRTSLVYQAYMEPTAAVADIDANGRIVLYTGIQDPVAARKMFAAAMGITPKQLRVVQMAVGGGFGGKLQPKAALLCAYAAWKTGKPVKLINTRHDDFVGGQPRVPMIIRVKLGATRDGTITAKEVKIVADNGAYTRRATSILLTASYRVDALYRIPNLRTSADLVYTNKTPTGAFRGYGNAQMHFALECEMDELAEALALDPLELRRKNGAIPDYVNPYGWKIKSCGLGECLDTVTEQARWHHKRPVSGSGKGIGLACCVHVSGNRSARKEYDGSTAMIRIDLDGNVSVFSGEADLGQGSRTVFAQIVAERLGVPIDAIEIMPIDTDISPLALGTFASRVTYLGGNAVNQAAAEARNRLLAIAGEELDIPVEKLEIAAGVIYCTDDTRRSLPLAAAVQAYAYRHGGEALVVTGSFSPDVEYPDDDKQGNISGAYPFGAHVAEVEVDRQTGQITVNKVYAAHDLGRAINPTLSEGQIEGGVVMGLGWAVSEQLIHHKGILANDQFLDYQIPTIMDMPEMQVTLVESGEQSGPYGAKALGEPTIIPTAPAIANAIYHAVGVRIRELPITPEEILKALHGEKL